MDLTFFTLFMWCLSWFLVAGVPFEETDNITALILSLFRENFRVEEAEHGTCVTSPYMHAPNRRPQSTTAVFIPDKANMAPPQTIPTNRSFQGK